MMKVCVDMSIFTESESVGHSAGEIELEALPRVGETLSFVNPKDGVHAAPGFWRDIKVERVDHLVGNGVSLSLEDVLFPTKAEGLAFMLYLEEGFGVYSNPTKRDD